MTTQVFARKVLKFYSSGQKTQNELSSPENKKVCSIGAYLIQIKSLVATDLLTFIVYSDEFNIDIETGLIKNK